MNKMISFYRVYLINKFLSPEVINLIYSKGEEKLVKKYLVLTKEIINSKDLLRLHITNKVIIGFLRKYGIYVKEIQIPWKEYKYY